MDLIIQGICKYVDSPIYVLEINDRINYMHNDYGKILTEMIRLYSIRPCDKQTIRAVYKGVGLTDNKEGSIIFDTTRLHPQLETISDARFRQVDSAVMKRFHEWLENSIRDRKEAKDRQNAAIDQFCQMVDAMGYP
jgi:hypothetical protein